MRRRNDGKSSILMFMTPATILLLRWAKRLRFVLLIIFPLIVVQFISSQTAPQAPQLRVTTRMVQVSVIVQDQRGEPLVGLTKDDFELSDQGKPQQIAEFSVESARVLPSMPAAPPVANVFSNRAEQQFGNSVSATAILIDTMNTEPKNMAFARRQLKTFFEEMQPLDRVAIYSLADGLTLVRDFTNDGASLLNALEGLQDSETRQMSGSHDPFDFQVREYFKTSRGEDTPRALISLAHHMAGIPGRKNLIWLSGSFPIATGFLDMGTRRSFEEDIDRAARALTDANIAVYPVDARGLMTDGYPDQHPLDSMNLLAQLTGGKASFNTNDIGGAIRRAVDDSRVTYTLGYYPDQTKWDGSFHEINVKVNRRGTQVRCRRGYFAAREPVAADQKQRAQRMLEAAADPLESTAVGLRLETISVNTRAIPHLKMMLTINARDLLMNTNADRWTGEVDVYYVEIGAKQERLASLARAVVLNLTPDAYDKTMKEGVKVVCDFPVKPGATVIRLVALDSDSSQMGTVTVPLSALFPKSSAR
jgi:VWFA-related protein